MPFSGKSFWTPRDAMCLADGEIGYDNSSRIEPKRGHQWVTDTTGPELFSNKKQAIEVVSNGPLGSLHLNASTWHNTSRFQSVSGQFTERLFGSETVQTVNVVDSSDPIVSGGHVNMGRKDFSDICGGNSSISLSVPHGTEDSSRSISFGGIRKIKVNQVRVAGTDLPTPPGHSYSSGDASAISLGATYNKTDSSNISLGPTNDSRDNDVISVGPNFCKADGSFISMGQAFNGGDGSFMLMGHNYTKGGETILGISQPFDKVDPNFITMGPSCGKGGSNAISITSSYDKGHEDYMITMAPNYSKENENFVPMATSYSKGDHSTLSVGSAYDKLEPNIASIDSSQDKRDSNFISMGDGYKGDDNNISFGDFHDESETDHPGSIISSYGMLMSNQNSAQTSEATKKVLVESRADLVVNNIQKVIPKSDNVLRSKEAKPSKKVPQNNFPSNVKSLLSTGMLDGVPVKYVSWSREKNLGGTIKGTGYLCGCNECDFAKALNAYEFERHANCKTKHPNNHIYFENGKTIYAVVQELKNTPQELLFDTIQNVTGSQINQKNFRIWKASYQAATRELQRIYGKEEVVAPS